MKIRSNHLWITVILLGWLFDLLFWGHTIGLNFVIYVLLILIGGFWLLLSSGVRPARSALFLVPLVLAFSTVILFRQEPLSDFLGWFFALFLMAGIAVSFVDGRWYLYSFADYVVRAFRLAGSVIANPIQFMIETRNEALQAHSESSSWFWPLLRGLLFSIPVVFVFAALLSSADLIFAQRLSDGLKVFQVENLPEYIFRLIYIMVIAYALAGVFLHAGSRDRDEKLLGIEKPLIFPIVGFIEAEVILGSVILLFAGFGIIQFQYFFGGHANINLSGYTYAEYAQRGFGELVIVALFSLLLIFGLCAIVRRDAVIQRRIFSASGVVLVLLVGVMLVSAYQRLLLYEDAYGFTRLRIYTHVFIIWLGLLLLIAVILELINRQRAFAFVSLMVAFGFGLSLSILNVDSFIVRENLGRVPHGRTLDVGYLASLSSDAIPTMVDFYKSPGIGAATRDRLGASLACFRAASSFRAVNKNDWLSFNISQFQADQSIQAVSNDLQTYRVQEAGAPAQVISPLGFTYDCYGYDD